MHPENGRIAKNSLALYFRTIFVMLIALYTSRVVLKSLGVEDYGIYNIVGGLVSIFVFINGAMYGATIRYITIALGKGDFKQLNVVFCTSLQIHAVISLIVVLLSETIGLWLFYNKMTIPPDRFQVSFFVFQMSLLTAVISILNVPYYSLLIAHERMASFAYISILDAVLKLIVAISLPFFMYDKLVIYSVLMFLTFLTIIVIYYVYCYRCFPESHYHFVKEGNLVKEMSGFAFWSLFSNFAYATYTQGVNVLLNIFFSPVVNAARAVSVQVQNAVSKFVQSFQSALNPQIVKNYAADNRERLLFLIDTSSRFSFFLLLVIVTPILVETDILLKFWLGEVPEHTSNFIRISILSSLITVMLNPLNIATQATGKIRRFSFVTGSVQLLILPLSYIALKLGGSPESVYYVYLVVSFLLSFVYMYITCSAIRISMALYVRQVMMNLYCVLILAAIIPICYNLYYSSTSFCSSVLNILIAEMSVLSCIFLIGLRKQEKSWVISCIRKKLFARWL